MNKLMSLGRRLLPYALAALAATAVIAYWDEIVAFGPGALLYSAGVPLSLFWAYYLLFSRWWASAIGRVLMALSTSLLAIIVISISKNVFGEWPGIEAVRLVVYTGMNISFWSLFISLRNIQRSPQQHPLKPRHEREEEKIS